MQIGARGHSVGITFIAAVIVITLISVTAVTASDVYTIANYPVEATARNAVAAKKMAIQQGRTAAFRSLLKRIVPVTAYQSITSLKQLDARPLALGVAVRSERSSTTRYIASLDFSFSQKAVREQLKRAGIPFADRQAPPTITVLIYSPPAANSAGPTMGAAAGTQLWRSIWAGLDLKNSVSPLELRRPTNQLRAATIQGVARGELAALSRLTQHYDGQPRVILAVAEPDLQARRLNVVIAGRDAAGNFSLKRQYRLDMDDFAYTLEFAAVVSQGVLEGRWKAVNAPAATSQTGAAGAQDVELWVEFVSLAQWRRLQKMLQEMPGVEALQTGGLSTNGASVKLRYPGGGEKLRAALAQQGRSLEPYQDIWLLR